MIVHPPNTCLRMRRASRRGRSHACNARNPQLPSPPPRRTRTANPDSPLPGLHRPLVADAGAAVEAARPLAEPAMTEFAGKRHYGWKRKYGSPSGWLSVWTNLDCAGHGDGETAARAARAKAAPRCCILGAMQKCNQPLARWTTSSSARIKRRDAIASRGEAAAGVREARPTRSGGLAHTCGRQGCLLATARSC